MIHYTHIDYITPHHPAFLPISRLRHRTRKWQHNPRSLISISVLARTDMQSKNAALRKTHRPDVVRSRAKGCIQDRRMLPSHETPCARKRHVISSFAITRQASLSWSFLGWASPCPLPEPVHRLGQRRLRLLLSPCFSSACCSPAGWYLRSLLSCWYLAGYVEVS